MNWQTTLIVVGAVACGDAMPSRAALDAFLAAHTDSTDRTPT